MPFILCWTIWIISVEVTSIVAIPMDHYDFNQENVSAMTVVVTQIDFHRQFNVHWNAAGQKFRDSLCLLFYVGLSGLFLLK